MIAAAVVAFMLLVSLPKLEELPVSGLGLGGDQSSSGEQSVAPAKVAAGAARVPSTSGTATGVAAHRKAPATTPRAAATAPPRSSRAGGTVGAERQAISTGDVAGRASSGHRAAGSPRQEAAPPIKEAAAPPVAPAPSQPSTTSQRPPVSTPAEGLTGVVGGHGRGNGASDQESPLSPVSKVTDMIPEPEASPPPQESSVSEAVRQALQGTQGNSHGSVAAAVTGLLNPGHGSQP